MKTGAVSLVLSAVALAVAVYASTQKKSPPARASGRSDSVAELERQVADLNHEVALLKSQRRGPRTQDDRVPDAIDHKTPAGEFDRPPEELERDPALAAIVDDAVDRKTKQVMKDLQMKANKKPGIEEFAAALELTTEQRASTEQVVVEGQRKVHEILSTPTADGTNLMEELVEIIARTHAQPGKDHGMMRLFGRLMTEKVPGTDETYAVQAEAVKSSMRATFKREWSKSQYREFVEWKVDPTEIQKVPGSPNDALGVRIAERAKELAEIAREEE